VSGDALSAMAVCAPLDQVVVQLHTTGIRSVVSSDWPLLPPVHLIGCNRKGVGNQVTDLLSGNFRVGGSGVGAEGVGVVAEGVGVWWVQAGGW
jgi:hypothetical protein